MKLRLALLQMNVAFGEPDINYTHVAEWMERAMEKDPDILVLPELWNVGFLPKRNLSELSDENGNRTRALIGDFAKKHHVNVVAGSVAVKEGETIYNRSYVFDRTGGIVSVFDKVHGFSLTEESRYFRMGDKVSHFRLDGIDCSMAICYDIRFPEFIRREILQGVDLFFVPAAWPLIRNTHWVRLNQVRAIENQVYLCAVNQCGRSGRADYAGESLLLDPWGEEICHLETGEDIACGRMDTDVIAHVRNHINVFQDRRPEIDTVL